MYICVCRAVSDKKLQQAIDQGTNSIHGLRDELGVIQDCGKCGCYVRDMLQKVQNSSNPTAELEKIAS
ncbi:(2Fe-2S)-binding protein [Candidatus Nitrosacidococcus tergens]|uniref:Bacterioferritin-associated ferredoxin n=1 Tax=Candidatus Nitrosacidococcus tergens TaxID=553981 RepID=A0A7G1QAH1_9GAMM|nr:(2Fe-2S)-binding protein [Candidatus Nitrosacidococcus tergens]CAB1276013.1 BFD domain protein (2Fe-2S)-binding domain protein [Candidatus Nitrosacidococcus tergens]